MKIRAIEVEDEGGKVTRYRLVGTVESTWLSADSFSYKPDAVVVMNTARCRCGHLESEHLPECIYKVEGCECSGYVGADGS